SRCGLLPSLRQNFEAAAMWPSGPHAVVQHRLGTTILRPAGNVIAYGDRPLLTVGNRPDSVGAHAMLDQEVPNRRRAPGADRNVVFTVTALVGVSLDCHRVLMILLQPAGLSTQSLLRFRRQFRTVG